MDGLPSGRVTLLFSDVEGSTKLLGRLGTLYAEALDGQRSVLRQAWAEHGGTELGTAGDSFYVVFATAEAAVAAGVQAQRELSAYPWPQGERVRVRIGVHTGIPTVHDGAYVGMDVHRAARVAGVAHGGQLVVSEATAQLIGNGVPPGVRLRDLGAHQLKDMPAREHLFQVLGEGLQEQFPPLMSLGASSSLPAPATSLVGRDGELAELAAVAGSRGVRLVTLTGPGGTGKTRLAIALAQQLTDAFPDGVYFVPLTAVRTGEVMWTSIAEVLDVPAESRTPPEFFAHVAHRTVLFVLDNLEQVVGADEVVAELLSEAPQVAVVATSRRPLHVPGEHEHAVPPLELPGDEELETVTRAGAVQLFAQRARMVQSTFEVNTDNAADVAAVCRRLDGLPLAVELAAARVELLSPRALLARLDEALDIAVSDSQGPSRQKTLRDTIAWSYELLARQQQSLFCRLGVFSGGADLDAITAVVVTADDGDLDVLDVVADLLDASLLTVAETPDGEPRIGLLETVRAFALDQLTSERYALPSQASAFRRHAEFYLGLAERAEPQLTGAQQLDWLGQLAREHDNLRAALEWSSGPHGDTPAALRLAGALWHFWEMSGALREAWHWFETVLALPDADAWPELLLRTCSGAGTMAWARGDYDRAEQLHERALLLARTVGDKAAEAFALNALGVQFLDNSDFDRAADLFEQAATLALAIDERRIAGMAHHNTGEVAFHRAEYARATPLYERAVAIWRELGDDWATAGSLRGIAATEVRQGNPDRAGEALRESLALAAQFGENNWIAEGLEGLAAVAEISRQAVTAVRLLGAADSLRRRLGTPMPPAERPDHDRLLGALRAAMGYDAFDRAWQDGQQRSAQDAVQEATRPFDRTAEVEAR